MAKSVLGTSITGYNYFAEGSATNGAYDPHVFLQPGGAADADPFKAHSVIIWNDGANDLLVSRDGVNIFVRIKPADKNVTMDFYHGTEIYVQGDGAAVPFRLSAW